MPDLPEPVAWGAAGSLDDSVRNAAVGYLRDLVATDRLSLERFGELTAAVLAAPAYGDLEAVLAAVPPWARYTPPERRLQEPMVLRVNTGNLRMAGRWQVPSEVVATVNTGNIVLDFSEAEFDARAVDLTVRVNTGRVDLIVPHGVVVQVISAGSMKNQLGTDVPLPGGPVIRLRSDVNVGGVRLRRPQQPRLRRRRRRLFPSRRA